MTQELLYTSAPRGLIAGSEGFATVAATRGLSSSWREALEGLCGYRPLFPPDDSRNPVTHAHLRLTVGGRTQSVLARIGPAGLDYTGRPNKFAHFLVVEPGKTPSAGPAWLLARPRLLETKWDGKVGWRERAPHLPDGDSEIRICSNWKRLTGDAGWAGVLAESFLQRPDRAVVLLFEPGTEILPLFEEAVALLPSKRRWAVTFNTYFTSLPPTAGCAWRAMAAGTPEAKSAARLPGAFVLDLTQRLAQAAGAQFVEAARTGHLTSGDSVASELLSASDFPVYRASTRSNEVSRTPIGIDHKPEWPAPVTDSEFHNHTNWDVQSRRRRLVTWLMVLGLLGGAGSFAVILLLKPPQSSEEPGPIAASPSQLERYKGFKLTDEQLAGIGAWFGRANREAAGWTSSQFERVFEFSKRAMVLVPTGKPVSQKDGALTEKVPSPAVSQLPPERLRDEFRQVSLQPLRENETELALANVVDLFGSAEQPRITFVVLQPGKDKFVVSPSTVNNTITLKRRQSVFDKTTKQNSVEEFDFVEFRLADSKILCRLLVGKERVNTGCWTDLFNSVLEVRDSSSTKPKYVALRTPGLGHVSAGLRIKLETAALNPSEPLYVRGAIVSKSRVLVEIVETKDGKPETRTDWRPGVFSDSKTIARDKEVVLLPDFPPGTKTGEKLRMSVEGLNLLRIRNASNESVMPPDIEIRELDVVQFVGGIEVPVYRIKKANASPDKKAAQAQ